MREFRSMSPGAYEREIEKNEKIDSVGDTVELRSGGRPMSVVNVGDGMVTCAWHDLNGSPHLQNYVIEVLSLLSKIGKNTL